jgi:hypothetical protein
MSWARKGKVAGNLGQNAATLQNLEASSTERPNHSGQPVADATGQAAMLRLLMARLNKLGLGHSGTENESILIAGQAYDLRSAAEMARQLERVAA